MKKFIYNFAIFFLAALTVGAQKDSLYLYSQPALGGEFKSIKMGVVEFDVDGIGVVTIKKYKIKSLRAASFEVQLEAADKKRYYGRIFPSPNDGKVLLQFTEIKEIDLDSISVMSYTRDKIGKRISGHVSLGFNYSKSTSVGKLNFDSRAKYESRGFGLLLRGSSNMSLADDTVTRETENLELQGTRNLSATWLAFGLLNYQRNYELGILRRYQQGAGIGNKVLMKPSLNAAILTGIVLNEEKGLAKTEQTVLAEVPVIIQFHLFKFGERTFEVNINQSTYFSLSQKGRIRNDGQVNVSWEIIKDFSLSFIFYNNFDSQPPNNTDNKFDYSLVFGIKYNF